MQHSQSMKFLFVLFLTFTALAVQAQNSVDYSAYWQRVYQYEVKDLPRSARQVVDSIYSLAKTRENTPQQIRSMIYLAKFQNILEEEAEADVMEMFEQELLASSGVRRAVLASLVAEFYRDYLVRNNWKIRQRTPLAENEINPDFRTWTEDQFNATVDSLHQLSLSDTILLQNTSLDDIEEILYNRVDQRNIRPTLYDLLAHRALDWYESQHSYKSISISREVMMQPTWRDTTMTNIQIRILDLYSSLMHLRKHDTSALAMLWTERTHYLSSKASNNDLYEWRTSLYDSLYSLYAEHPAGTLLQYELANDLYEKGSQYSPERPELQYAWKEAKQLAEAAIEAFPDSFGAEKCRALINRITIPSFEAMMETYIPVRRHSPVLIQFRNTDSVRVSVRRISTSAYLDPNESLSDLIQAAEEVNSFSVGLPVTDDFRQHSTEIALPPLPAGTYGLIVKSNKNQEAIINFQVTNLVLDVLESGPDIRFRTLHRISGLPLNQAQIMVSFPQTKQRPVRLDGPGTIRPENGQYNAMAVLDGDTTILNLHHYYYDRNAVDETEDRTARILAFTDRSIYRPGQMLYFKAILTQQYKGKSSVVPGEYINVYLEDPNGEEIVDLRLKTNEYGSVSGEIKLPSDRITGEYWLYADEDYEEGSKFYDEKLDDLDWAEIPIRVEEYKRPTFEVTFDPVTEAIAIGDSIGVSGQATAFSGAPLSNVAVTMKVEKSSRDLFSYSYSREVVTIAKIRTDANGKFTFTFRSTPDQRPGRYYPVQKYHISADVHDITGEVRSADSYVRAALHAVEVTTSVPKELTAGDTLKAFITSENINQAPAASAGTLEIIRLQSPNRSYRNRKWEAPDMPLYDEATYRQLFPDREFENELDKNTWEQLEVVASYPFALEGKEIVPLTSELAPGHYLVRTVVDSAYRAAPVKETYLWVKSQETVIPEFELFSIDIPLMTKNDTISVISGVDSLYVTVDLLQQEKILSSKELLLTSGAHIVIFDDLPEAQPFTIRYSYVWHNDFGAGSQQVVQAVAAVDNLGVDVLTFRDKIDPGAQEEWQFRITGENGKGATAEVLASMYDASLDQFSGHAWEVPSRRQEYYYDPFNTLLHQNFGSQRLWQWGRGSQNISIPTRIFDELNRFGFSLTDPEQHNNSYLVRLKNFMNRLDTLSEVSNGFNPDTQKGYVSGLVVNRKNEPLPGVNVVIRGTSTGTVTDIDGKYYIKANPDQELVFSFVGYSTLTASPGAGNSINIVLAEDMTHLSEVVVTGYGVEEKQSLTGSAVMISAVSEETIMEEVMMDLDVSLEGRAAGVQIRGMNALQDVGVLVVVDGVVMEAGSAIPSDIANYQVLKDESATALYGSRAANGVVIITTTEKQKRLDEQLASVTARGDLRETAFFYPHLTTNRKGDVSFSFTSPENLTRWKLQLLAHDKSARWGLQTMQTITQKELMVVPHLPRFLREDDEITITAKVVNLTGEPKSGTAVLSLKDAISGATLDDRLIRGNIQLPFTVGPNEQSEVSWKLAIPGGLTAVEAEIKAATDSQGDGERHVLPVLPNRTLVTESISLYTKEGQENTFVLENLNNTTSTTLEHQSLRLTLDTNPVWTALQSLPYLMEFPYECSEQTFARLFGNHLGSYLLTQNPQIAEQLTTWRENGSTASPLEKNQEMMELMLRETPWWRDAMEESQAGERLAKLMQQDSLDIASRALLDKLIGIQNSDGGMPWFAGGYSNRFITQHISLGLIRLISLTSDDQLSTASQSFLNQMKNYLDRELLEDFGEERSLMNIHYQYFYLSGLMEKSDEPSEDQQRARNHYYEKMKESWQSENLMLKSLAVLSFQLHGDETLAGEVLNSIMEYSLRDEELGMYWKGPGTAWYWHQSQVESHVMAMHAFDVIMPDGEEKQAMLEDQKVWLLRQKQTQHWPSTKATTEAVHAMLSLGADWVAEDPQVEVRTGAGQVLESSVMGEYAKTWTVEEIRPELAKVEVEQQGVGASWGSLRWQYFEEYDNIRQTGESLQVEKQLYRVIQTKEGEKLEKVGSGEPLNNGDLVRVRLILRTDRTLEFIHLKDQRAAGFEPVDVLSGYAYQEGLRYYQSTRDAATHFFFDHAEQGVYVFEYDLRATHKGSYASGLATMENMYSPAYNANSESIRIRIE